MRNGRKISISLTLVLLIGLFAGLLYLSSPSPSPTPELAIRKYVFFKGKSPIEAFNLQITPTDYVDRNYGQQFIVEGFRDNATGMIPRFFYLKKTAAGWSVVSAGTGP
ncbi:MAG: hypothetical protein AB1426_09280 [Bacillota bacterium]